MMRALALSLAVACADAQANRQPGGRRASHRLLLPLLYTRAFLTKCSPMVVMLLSAPKEVDLGQCTIMSVFQDLTAITTSEECRAGCNGGSGDCPDEWYPSAQDSCSADCGIVFEPFWDMCGVMLTEAQMGGMDEMGLFYDICLESLYPPGSCGTFCNEHTYDCYMGEIHQACCDEHGANCDQASDVPHTCPVGCAIVFPEFMETCSNHMDEHPEINIEDWRAFEEQCLELDGLALVDFAMELIAKGCLLHLSDEVSGSGGHRRFLQLLGGWFAKRLASGEDSTCSFDDLDDYSEDVDYACCGPDGSRCPADGGPPSACSQACAVALHTFTTSCGATLDNVLSESDALRTQMEGFETTCMDTISSSHLFLEAIMDAVCPESGAVPLYSEDGALAEGWSNTEVTDVGSAGTVHGPWGNDVTEVTLHIDVPEGIIECEISWRSWAADSRDGEIDSVQVNGEEIWSMASRCYAGNDGWEIGPPDYPNPWGGENGQVCFHEETVEMDCNSEDGIELTFLSGIDQAEADESWAFSNVRVVGGYGEATLLAENEQGGAVADGWSNSEVTDVGSAGLVHGPWGNDVRDVSIDISIPAGYAECEVSWRSWAADSRDGEVDSVQIDGEEVWAHASRCYAGDDGWELGPPDYPNPWGGENGQVCFEEVSVEIACDLDGDGNMHLNFLSGIDQGESDESWAFSGVRVVARPASTSARAGQEAMTLLHEDGADAQGWSNTVITSAGSAGMVHGPWGNDVRDVSIDVPVPSGITQCEVSWRSWALDSRDGEVDSVQIDGQEVWSMPSLCYQNVNSPGTDGWELGPPDFPIAGNWGAAVCFHEETVQVPCSNSLHINFLSAIDQGVGDEGWAFSDVTVIAGYGETTLLAENDQGGAVADGWSNSEVTDVGSAGLVHGPWGNDVRDVSIDISIPDDMHECEVSWRSWAIDSRDGEIDSVQIDGVEVWAMASHCYQGNDGWENGPEDFPNPWQGQNGQVCFQEVTVQVACSGTLHVNFLSGIDQEENDEAWAFSGVHVVARP